MYLKKDLYKYWAYLLKFKVIKPKLEIAYGVSYDIIFQNGCQNKLDVTV